MSVTYSSGDEESDYVPAADVSDLTRLSLDAPPTWKVSEAVWPTADDEAMTFVGQVELPDTELMRRLLTWDVSVFLFMSRRAPTRFKIVEQPSDFQSADEHYHAEGAQNAAWASVRECHPKAHVLRSDDGGSEIEPRECCNPQLLG